MSKAPPTPSGKVILVATLTAKPGKGDRLEELLAIIRRVSVTHHEPGTLTYRTQRVVTATGEKGDKFVVYEEYLGDEAFQKHAGSETNVTGFQNLLKANAAEGILAGPPTLDFFEEFF